MDDKINQLRILNLHPNLPASLFKILKHHNTETIEPRKVIPTHITQNPSHLALLNDDPALINLIKKIDPRIEIIVFSDKPEDAFSFIKNGASAYFTQPVDTKAFLSILDNIVDNSKIRKKVAKLEAALQENYLFADLVIGKNPKMLDIFQLIKAIAPHYQTILVTGETGTGKEVIAKALHSLSPVHKKPFVTCNCGGFTETLLASELFGHKRGTFTGADKDKPGLFEAAGDGNIFLDEIGELPLSFQTYFLRVLQNGEFRPVGDTKSIIAKCRVIAASNQDLKQEIDRGKFRKDLYYRLTPVAINLPPLRDRKDDIPMLCKHFLEKFRIRFQKNIQGISRPTQKILMEHDWPGNIRELENVIEQAAMMTSETFIKSEYLPGYLTSKSKKTSAVSLPLEQIIKHHIQMILDKCNGNRTHAAKVLKISRRSLLRKIKKYHL